MNTCPHCHSLAIPAWEKLDLRPGSVIPCKQCGKKVGVSGTHMLACYLAPMVVTFLVASALGWAWYLWLMAWLPTTVVVWIVWVPVISKEEK